MCAQSCSWPILKVSSDAVEEYTLLYALHIHGFTRFPLTQSILPSKSAIERRVRSIVSAILKQGEIVVDRPILSPEEWRQVRESESLPPNDAVRVFDVVRTFGVHETSTHGIHVLEIRRIASIPGPDILIAEFIADTLAMAVELQSDDSVLNFDPFPAARSLEGRISARELRDAVFVCRHLEIIRSFCTETGSGVKIESDRAPIARSPHVFGSDAKKRLLLGLCEMGVLGVERDEIFGNPEIAKFLEDPHRKLIVASQILRQLRAATIHVSATLEVDFLGRIVSGSRFRSRECIYPVGYASRRNFGKWIGSGMLDDWYQCEIQSVFVRPVFIIREPRDDTEEIVELTPDRAFAALMARYGGTESTAIGQGEVAFGLTVGEIVSRVNEMVEAKRAEHERDESDESDDESIFKEK
jgi:hypothetical protein